MIENPFRILHRAPDARTARRRLGDAGERSAAAHLEALGFRIVATNVEVPLEDERTGRRVVAEIDLVAYDGATLAFVEVKTRASEGLFPVESAVGAHKRRLLARAAARYRRALGVAHEPYRFDVVAVVKGESGRDRVRLTRGMFSAGGGARARDE